jgi:cytochrome P450
VQLWALFAAASREVMWGLRAVSCEIRQWRSRAAAIPDPCLRKDALDSLNEKRASADGAALFWILTKRPNRGLLRLLVTYEVMADFLDSTNERGAYAGMANGRRLHVALIDALDPDQGESDHYHYHPWNDDGDYLQTLIQTCRTGCSLLPSYTHICALATRAATNAQVLGINHELDSPRRDAALEDWVKCEFPDGHILSWFELTAAASAWLSIFALLALAAEPTCSGRDMVATYTAYFPWISLTGTMLDSYVDSAEDVTNGDHSYVAHYPSTDAAAQRICELIRRSTQEARALSNDTRHTVIVASMIAMYLSKNSARTPATSPTTRSFIQAGGPLATVLIPILRGWRRIYDPPSRVKPACPLGPRSHSVLQTVGFARRPLAYLDRCGSRYGRRFTLYPIGFPPLAFLSDLNDIKALFKAPPDALHPGEGGEKIKPLVGPNSFMLLDENEHLSGRKTILPAFHNNAVLMHADLVNEVLQREIATWPVDTPVALHPRLRALTLRIILRTIFTPTGPVTDDQLSALHERLLATLSITASAAFTEPLLRHGPGLRVWRRFLRARAEADELIFALIDEHRKTVGGPGDVLDMLLAAQNTDGKPMSQAQIRDNVMSLILAGHETTSSQLAWAFQLLAHHPHVQARLTDEIDRADGEKYLMATIHEVLRHRPVFLFAIPRAVKQPIDIGGWTYHPPTQLLACIYLVHHDPQLYPRPHEFRPERFLGAPPGGAYAWLPWGGGRKRCPGLHLATFEMQTVLRAVLSQMTVGPASRRMERPRWQSVIVTPHAGSRVVLRRRTRHRRAVFDRRAVNETRVLHDANVHHKQANNPLSEHF